MSKIELSLRAVIYEENDVYIAHCLEMDIATDGKTPRKAVENMIDLVNFKVKDCIKHNAIDSIHRPAPRQYFRLFDEAKKKMRTEKLRKARGFKHELTARQYAFAS